MQKSGNANKPPVLDGSSQDYALEQLIRPPNTTINKIQRKLRMTRLVTNPEIFNHPYDHSLMFRGWLNRIKRWRLTRYQSCYCVPVMNGGENLRRQSVSTYHFAEVGRKTYRHHLESSLD